VAKPRMPGWPGPNIETAYSRGGNAFNFMRLCFAFAVLVWHTEILGYGKPGLPGGIRIDLGSLSVCGFFALSGFLICRSARRSHPLRYWWHRTLRIFPGYWVCLVVTAFVIAPLLWLHQHGSIHGFRSAPNGPVGYLLSNWTTASIQGNIAGLLAHQPYPLWFNGSLWTLPYELMCYLVVGALALVAVLRAARPVVLVLTAGMHSVLIHDYVNAAHPLIGQPAALRFPFFGPMLPRYLLIFGTVFMLGAVAELYRDRIPLNDVLGVTAAVLVVGSIAYQWVVVGTSEVLYAALLLPYAYLLLWLGVRIPGVLRRIGRRNDYSYGVYIYAFVIQQSLAALGAPKLGLLGYLLLSAACTFAFAFASWHLVEKRALRLKHWTPRPWAARRTSQHGVPVVPSQPTAVAAEVSAVPVGERQYREVGGGGAGGGP
jgi:peptidoglycan/LPS O-acetylase OafA/YrhL